jgi:hypothetical protein
MKVGAKIIAIVMLWGVLAYIIGWVEPEQVRDVVIPGSYLPMTIPFAFALWYTSTVILRSGKKGLLLALMGISLLYLMILSLLTTYTVVAVLLFFGYELYQLRKPKKNNLTPG